MKWRQVVYHCLQVVYKTRQNKVSRAINGTNTNFEMTKSHQLPESMKKSVRSRRFFLMFFFCRFSPSGILELFAQLFFLNIQKTIVIDFCILKISLSKRNYTFFNTSVQICSATWGQIGDKMRAWVSMNFKIRSRCISSIVCSLYLSLISWYSKKQVFKASLKRSRSKFSLDSLIFSFIELEDKLNWNKKLEHQILN